MAVLPQRGSAAPPKIKRNVEFFSNLPTPFKPSA
jgi:hypothetical protein